MLQELLLQVRVESGMKKIVKIDGFPAYAPDLAKSNDGFDPESFNLLYQFEDKNYWFKARNLLIISLIKKYKIFGDTYLEIGCGTGYVLRAIENNFPHMVCWGSEIYTAGLKYTQERMQRSNLIQMDATCIPFQKKFNLVGAYDVIEHIDDDRRVLAGLYKALIPGGNLILTVPQHQFLWSAADEYACHKRRYSRSELKKKLTEVGFEVRMLGSYTSLLFPLMLISRIRMKNKKYNPDSEFKMPFWLNKLFELILVFEVKLTTFGVRFPFGGSLIAIARKA